MMKINLTPLQWGSIVVALLVLGLLLFFPTKPKKLILEEQSRALNTQSTDVFILKKEAFEEIPEGLASRFRLLDNQLETTADTLSKISLLQGISGEWYENGFYGIAGYYAETAADLSGNAQAYGIAGTTYAIGINRAEKEKEKIFCKQKSLDMMEKAISMDPEEISHQINRGVILAEHPDADNPMKGILILIDLNKKYPKNVSIINNLAKFALQTNQLDRAEARLMEALSLDSNNNVTICLLAQLYKTIGNLEKESLYKSKCRG